MLQKEEIIMLVLVGIFTCIITGVLASWKGYNFFLWILAGGAIGLVILAFLPNINKGDFSEQEVKEKRDVGNIIGTVISVIAIIYSVVQLVDS